MYTFCSCDATMIPDVDHHQYFSFWDPWLQHYKRMSPAYMDGVFLSYFYLCFNLASEHFLFLDFSYGSILMSERISGRHALRTSSQPRQHHTTSRSFALLDFLFGRPAFPGRYGTESATSLFFTRCFTRGAGSLPLLLLAFVRLEICTVLRNSDLLLARNRSGQFWAW